MSVLHGRIFLTPNLPCLPTLVSQVITLPIPYDDYVMHACFYITPLSTSMGTIMLSHFVMNHTPELESCTITTVLGLKGRSLERVSCVRGRTSTDLNGLSPRRDKWR